MDDFKIILYILAAVAYFLLTQWRKAFKSPAEEEEQPRPMRRHVDQEHPSKPVTSFEDILRELQPKAEKGKAVIEAAREEVKENIPPLAPVSPPEPKYKKPPESKYKNYETPAPRVLSWELPAEAKLAAKRSEERRQSAFKAYDQQERQERASRYTRLLQNPASAREAFVLSEIFTRKYN